MSTCLALKEDGEIVSDYLTKLTNTLDIFNEKFNIFDRMILNQENSLFFDIDDKFEKQIDEIIEDISTKQTELQEEVDKTKLIVETLPEDLESGKWKFPYNKDYIDPLAKPSITPLTNMNDFYGQPHDDIKEITHQPLGQNIIYNRLNELDRDYRRRAKYGYTETVSFNINWSILKEDPFKDKYVKIKRDLDLHSFDFAMSLYYKNAISYGHIKSISGTVYLKESLDRKLTYSYKASFKNIEFPKYYPEFSLKVYYDNDYIYIRPMAKDIRIQHVANRNLAPDVPETPYLKDEDGSFYFDTQSLKWKNTEDKPFAQPKEYDYNERFAHSMDGSYLSFTISDNSFPIGTNIVTKDAGGNDVLTSYDATFDIQNDDFSVNDKHLLEINFVDDGSMNQLYDIPLTPGNKMKIKNKNNRLKTSNIEGFEDISTFHFTYDKKENNILSMIKENNDFLESNMGENNIISYRSTMTIVKQPSNNSTIDEDSILSFPDILITEIGQMSKNNSGERDVKFDEYISFLDLPELSINSKTDLDNFLNKTYEFTNKNRDVFKTFKLKTDNYNTEIFESNTSLHFFDPFFNPMFLEDDKIDFLISLKTEIIGTGLDRKEIELINSSKESNNG
jgi:hypothetical protein